MLPKGVSVLVVIAILVHCSICALTGSVNVERLRKIFDENIKSSDPTNFFYAVKGYSLLNVQFPSSICQDLKNVKFDDIKIEQVYYISNAAALAKCQNNLGPEVLKAANSVLDKKDASLVDLFYAVKTMKALGKATGFDKETGFKNLLELLKSEETPTNIGYLMQLCSELECGSWFDIKSKNILNQADEVDGIMLQFEGGLPATANILNAILRSGKAQLTQDQINKFAQYILYRRSVNTPKGAALLLETATALSQDKQKSPLSIIIKSKPFIKTANDMLTFQVTDLIGKPVTDKTVTLESATRLDDGVVVASKKKLAQKGDTFELQLGDTPAGKYKLVLSSGQSTATINVFALTSVRLSDAGLAIADQDGASSPQFLQISYPNTNAEVLNADHMNKIVMKFRVSDAAGKPYTVQQAFARLSSMDNQEVIFVAEPDKNNVYKLEIQVSTLSQYFNHKSGIYVMDIYIGDSSISEPIEWRVAKLQLSFADTPKTPAQSRSVPLPEITHMFRAPEPRPPKFVSDLFSIAALSPLLLLIILWGAIGINVKDFPFTLSAIVFHAGLGSILGLLVIFWLQLNMFETVRYLLGLGLITFVSGHRLLRHLVKTNKF